MNHFIVRQRVLGRNSIFLLAVIFSFLFSSTTFAGINGVLQDFDGNIQSLDDHTGHGKWLVVMLWASDCQVCNKEAHQYVKFHSKYAKSTAQVLGISLDGDTNIKAAKQFLKRHNINFPNLIADPRTVTTLYQQLSGNPWIGTPSFLVYNPKGELIGAQAGAVPTEVIESFIAKESQNSEK